MTLRELLIERILFQADDDEIADRYAITGDLDDELATLSDIDLLELYESVCFGVTYE